MPKDPLKFARPKKKRPQFNRDATEKLRVDVKRKEALEMAIAYVPIPEIAEKFGVTRKTVYAWITQEHEALLQAMSKNAAIYKARLNQKYDDLMRQWSSLALALANELDVSVSGIKMMRGKPVAITLEKWEIASKATDHVLKIAKQQAELNQIAVPIPDKIEGGDVNLLLIQQVSHMFVKKDEQPVLEAEIINETPIAITEGQS